MARYITSDLHLGHKNIIEYCDRPFDTIDEMNHELVRNWNRNIGDDDVVFFLGDLGAFADEDQLNAWLDELNGRIVFIEGNHDHHGRYTTDLNTHQYYILEQGNREVLLTHKPVNTPQFWDDWVIHGHHHNNHPHEYPFVNPDRQLVNVSIELTGYQPLKVDYVIDCFEHGEWMAESTTR